MKSVIVYTNGAVMVFDEEDEQASEYQGRVQSVAKRIIDTSDSNTVFYISNWREWMHSISKEDFIAMFGDV